MPSALAVPIRLTHPAPANPGAPFGRIAAPPRYRDRSGATRCGASDLFRADQLPGLTRIEAFEAHLTAVLNSGVWVYFEGGRPRLLQGRPSADPVWGLRLVIGPSLDGTASCLHVLGPGLDASFALPDGAFLGGASHRRRIDLIRYWCQLARPHLLRVWNLTRQP